MLSCLYVGFLCFRQFWGAYFYFVLANAAFYFFIFSSKFIAFPLWFVIFQLIFNRYFHLLFGFCFVWNRIFAVLLFSTFWNIYFFGVILFSFLINCVYLCWLFCGFVLLICAQRGRYLIHVKYSTRYSYFHDSYIHSIFSCIHPVYIIHFNHLHFVCLVIVISTFNLTYHFFFSIIFNSEIQRLKNVFVYVLFISRKNWVSWKEAIL